MGALFPGFIVFLCFLRLWILEGGLCQYLVVPECQGRPRVPSLAPVLSVGSVLASLFGLLLLLRDCGGSGSVLVLLLQKLLHDPISIFLLLFGLRGANLQESV